MTRTWPAPAGPTTDAGTPEADWRSWLATRTWPRLTVDPAWRSVLVCAAHPDDDILAVGGLMVALARAGVAVRLLAATDGEGSHPGSPTLPPPELARRRVGETDRALATLGVRPAATDRLGLPDAGLAGVEDLLTVEVTRCAAGADAVVAPWAGDAHPDHDALGRAAAAAAGRAGVPLLAFPVWTWHWATPGDGRVSWDRAHVVDLPAAVRTAKRAAVDCFTTQVRPLGPAPEDDVVLPPEVLAHFDRDVEVVFPDDGAGRTR